MQDHITAPRKSPSNPTELTPEDIKVQENIKTKCINECHTLAENVEAEQKLLEYAKSFEHEFGLENIGSVITVLKDYDYSNEELENTPRSEILKDIRLEVESAIKEKKKNEQAQIEKEIDKNNSELAKADKNIDSSISELSQANQNLNKEDSQLATRVDVLSNESEGKKLSIPALKNDVFSKIKPQNIAGLKLTVASFFEKGDISQAILNQAQGFIAQHEATLQSFKHFFKPNNPQEQAVFQNILTNSKLDLSAKDNSQIYADVFAQIDAGIQDEDRKKALKNDISKKLGIDHPDIDTGGDVQQALRTPSSDGGTFYDKEKPLHIRKGISAFVDGNDRSMLEAKIPGRTDRTFDITGWSPDRVTELSNFLNLYIISEKAGISSFLETAFDIDFALADDFDYQKSIESRQTIEAMLGFNKGYNGRIIGESEIGMLKWQMQILSDKGDATQDDHSIANARIRLENLGVRDTSGKIDFEVLQAIGSYTRGIYMTGVPDYYLLREHLHTLFPNRVPLIEENEEKEVA